MDWTGLNAKTTARSSLCVCVSPVCIILFCFVCGAVILVSLGHQLGLGGGGDCE